MSLSPPPPEGRNQRNVEWKPNHKNQMLRVNRREFAAFDPTAISADFSSINAFKSPVSSSITAVHLPASPYRTGAKPADNPGNFQLQTDVLFDRRQRGEISRNAFNGASQISRICRSTAITAPLLTESNTADWFLKHPPIRDLLQPCAVKTEL